MKNKIDKKEQFIESNELSENIDTVDPAFFHSMYDNPNFQNTSTDSYYQSPISPINQRDDSDHNLYDRSPLMQRRKPSGQQHSTTHYHSNGVNHEYLNPIIHPYDYYDNYTPYANSQYPYFIPFMPFIYQLDEYDEY